MEHVFDAALRGLAHLLGEHSDALLLQRGGIHDHKGFEWGLAPPSLTVDVEGVAEPDGRINGGVAADDCTGAQNRRLDLVGDSISRPGGEINNVSAQSAGKAGMLQNFYEFAPRIEGAGRMNNADDASLGLQLNCDGQSGEGFGEFALNIRRVAYVPSAAVHHVVAYIHVPAVKSDSHVLVVALHGVEPRLSQPIERLVGLWATINQIANRKQAVTRWIKVNRIQCGLQLSEAAVYVADDQVAAFGVAREAMNKTSHLCRLLGGEGGRLDGVKKEVVKGPYLGIPGVVFAVLDAENGVVRESACASNAGQVAAATLQLNYNPVQGIGIFVHASILDIFAHISKSFLPASFIGRSENG